MARSRKPRTSRPTIWPELDARLARIGWYRTDLARATGIPVHTIGRLMVGEVLPTEQERAAIAAAVDGDSAVLFQHRDDIGPEFRPVPKMVSR